MLKYNPYGELIRQVRQEKGLTIQQLATYADLSYAQLWKIETNRAFPRQRTIEALNKVLKDERLNFK